MKAMPNACVFVPCPERQGVVPCLPAGAGGSLLHNMLTLNVPSAAARLPFSLRGRSRCTLSVRASGGNNSSSFAEGARVKVVKPIKVYHVPKNTDGLLLEGMEGTLTKDVSQYNGKVLSANLKYKVQFETQKDGAPLKFVAHLDEDEIQSV